MVRFIIHVRSVVHSYENRKVYKGFVRYYIMKNTVQKTSKLSHDGRQLMTRIPKAIQEEANLEKGDELTWKADGDKLEVKTNE